MRWGVEHPLLVEQLMSLVGVLQRLVVRQVGVEVVQEGMGRMGGMAGMDGVAGMLLAPPAMSPYNVSLEGRVVAAGVCRLSPPPGTSAMVTQGVVCIAVCLQQLQQLVMMMLMITLVDQTRKRAHF